MFDCFGPKTVRGPKAVENVREALSELHFYSAEELSRLTETTLERPEFWIDYASVCESGFCQTSRVAHFWAEYLTDLQRVRQALEPHFGSANVATLSRETIATHGFFEDYRSLMNSVETPEYWTFKQEFRERYFAPPAWLYFGTMEDLPDPIHSPANPHRENASPSSSIMSTATTRRKSLGERPGDNAGRYVYRPSVHAGRLPESRNPVDDTFPAASTEYVQARKTAGPKERKAMLSALRNTYGFRPTTPVTP